MAVGLVASATAFAATPEAATVERAAARVAPPDRALLISDSAWLGIHFYGTVDAVRGFPHTLALASCRRRVVRSCTNYDGFVPATLLDVVRDQDDSYSTLIVATGYNDSDRAFASEFDTIVATARELGYRRIVWLTPRPHHPVPAHPDVVIADWATYARTPPDGWFAPDGIHLRTPGTYAAGDYISRKLAHLDGRACPAPLRSGEVPPDPCPDPDDTGAIVDLESVYPLDRQAPRPSFQMEFVGHGAWPEPAWWER